MEVSRCFLSIPVSGVFSQVREAIADPLRRIGVEPLLTDDFFGSSVYYYANTSATSLPHDYGNRTYPAYFPYVRASLFEGHDECK
jgi:hypothetical protein